MRGRTFRAIIKGYTSPDDDGAEDALLLTERLPERDPSTDWWFDIEIRFAMDGPMKHSFQPEWENDFDPWPEDESAVC